MRDLLTMLALALFNVLCCLAALGVILSICGMITFALWATYGCWLTIGLFLCIAVVAHSLLS